MAPILKVKGRYPKAGYVYDFEAVHTRSLNKFNIAREKSWLEDDPFVLGFGNFSGANC